MHRNKKQDIKIDSILICFLICPGGGIGRRSRLKICHLQGCEGSIPFPGTLASYKQSRCIRKNMSVFFVVGRFLLVSGVTFLYDFFVILTKVTNDKKLRNYRLKDVE